jgi:N-acetylglucosaminyldiphosphoundecaprenol N-acetyl-beta-D-mannosaminyltransferase
MNQRDDDMEKQPLLNTYVNNVSMDETLQEISRLIEEKKKSYIVAINVDVVMKMEKDEYLKKIADEADLTLVDGKPLVWIAKWHKHPVKAKISGSDMVPELCRVAAEKEYSIFIIGGKKGIAEKAKANLEKQLKNIKIVGTYSPPLGFERNKPELEKINAMMSIAHPDILIVCFGCPKQEKWIYENYKKYDATVSICAGATVDFLAGNVNRAPKWMADHGFEWIYRLFQEPKRLFKRYLVDDIKIIKLVWKYRHAT